MIPRPAILKPCEDPGKATVEEGVILLDGPDGVAVAMTPDCATGTAHSLLAAAREAREAPSTIPLQAFDGEP